MPTNYKITVKPKDGTPVGWSIQHFLWVSPDAPEPEAHTITDWIEDDGVFSAHVDLQPGTHGLICNLFQTGRSVEIDLSPRPQIVQPQNAKWPFQAKVPPTMTQALRVRYFEVPQS